MTDHVPASASFEASAGLAEPTSALTESEGTPNNSFATVHAVPMAISAEDTDTTAPNAVPAPAQPGEADYGPEPRSFAQMGLSEEVLRALTEMGFREPMPVQSRTYRPIMAGRDLIVQSRTGSGKTAAFGIPFVQGLIDSAVDCQNGRIQVLVIGPTRELALQVGTEISRIAAHRRISITSVYGGAPMGKQVEALKAGSHMVAGTPGRILDHLRRGTLQLDGLRAIVLDEADEMLSMGFLEDIIEILRRCPKTRQTLLFSATMPDEVVRLAQRYQHSPLMLTLSVDSIGVSDIAHAYYMVSGMGRTRDLLRVLQVERPDSAMIFCNTREETSHVAEFLRNQGLDAEPISSDLTQAERERVMGRMKRKSLHYLVATDVAARGIDISDLSHVINYTFPESAEVYVHRTGRTGRAGKAGVAISLISPRELGNFYYLKLTYKIRPEERTLPSEAELQTLREGQYLDRLLREFSSRKPAAEFRTFLKRVMSSEEGERVLALLLEQHLGRPAALAAETSAGPTGHAAHPHRDQAAAPAAPISADANRERRPSRERSPGRDGDSNRDDRDSRRAGRGRQREDEFSADSRNRRRGAETRRREDGREGAAPVAGSLADAAPAPRLSRPQPNLPKAAEASAPAPAPAPVASAVAAPTSASSDIIHVEDGRDFWEAWVDARRMGQDSAAVAEEPAKSADGENGTDSEEGDRRGRRRRRERPEYVPAPGEVRLYLNLGRRDQVTEESLVAFLAQRGISRYPIDLHSTHIYMYVPEAQVDAVIAALSGALYGQRAVLCERARR